MISLGRAAARVGLVCVLVLCGEYASAQLLRHRTKSRDHAKSVASRSSSLTFMMKNGSCVDGPIAKLDTRAVTVQQGPGPQVKIARGDLERVSQWNALVYSARSSWSDVEAVHLRPRETLVFKFRDGKVVKGQPFSVDADGVVFKHDVWFKKRYAKDRITTVDYLRMKPDSAAFDYFAQEGPAMLFFYPEFYDRVVGLEGRIPVRLYDAVRHEDDALLSCSRR